MTDRKGKFLDRIETEEGSLSKNMKKRKRRCETEPISFDDLDIENCVGMMRNQTKLFIRVVADQQSAASTRRSH